MSTQKQCPQCRTTFDASQNGCPACQIKMGLGIEPTQAASVIVPEISIDELAKKFEDLEILEVIGVGGMGAVYRVRQKKLDRIVALKIIRPDISESAEFLQRFEREAKAMARLNHPNIVSIYDFGTESDVCYYLMELVDGPDLAELCKSESLTPSESLEIVTQVCRAMQYAHDQGVVHRDIKPTNILLNRDGVVKIADFGLAKLCSSGEPTTQLTQTKQVFGTPRYMAPEQIEATREVDHRADIYSLGVVFYELLTGELPLGRFDPPSEKIQIDVRLDEVVLRALQKHPERRYQEAHEFQTDISRIVQPVPPVKSTGVQKDAFQNTDAANLDRPPWQVAVLLIPGVIMAALGLFFVAANLSLGYFEHEMVYSRQSMVFAAVLLFLTGSVLLVGGLIYRARSRSVEPLPGAQLKSPVRKLLNYRNLVYTAMVGALLTVAFPWLEFGVTQNMDWLGMTGKHASVHFIFAYEMWIGIGVAALVLIFLPLMVFIDLYEGQRMYFSAAQLILGALLANAAICVMELHPKYLLQRDGVLFELVSALNGGYYESGAVYVLSVFGFFLVITAILRIGVVGVQRFWSEPFRRSTGEVLTKSGTRMVRWTRAFLDWIRSIS